MSTPEVWVWEDGALYNAADLAKRNAERDADVYEFFPEAIVQTDSGAYGPYGADRSLIQHAPDLYAALKQIVTDYDKWTGATTDMRDPEADAKWERARIALAKAEGKTNG